MNKSCSAVTACYSSVSKGISKSKIILISASLIRPFNSILPVSHMIHGVYDIDGVSLSMPAIVGADGIESDIPINLSGEEALKLKESADSLKKIMETIEL